MAGVGVVDVEKSESESDESVEREDVWVILPSGVMVIVRVVLVFVIGMILL